VDEPVTEGAVANVTYDHARVAQAFKVDEATVPEVPFAITVPVAPWLTSVRIDTVRLLVGELFWQASKYNLLMVVV
jgi:hypothetical protein